MYMHYCTTLGENVDATAVAAQTAIDFGADGDTPYIPGSKAIGMIVFSPDVAGAAGVGKIQSSPDNSVFTDQLLTATGVKAAKMGEITLARYMRLNVTVGWTAGVVSAYILA